MTHQGGDRLRRSGIDALHRNSPPHGCVLAVDDQAFFRATLRQLVNATSSLVVVGEADSGEGAVEMARELQPDLVLIDVHMRGLDGMAATRRIKALREATVVVLISTTHPDELPPDAERCSADEIVWKRDLRPKLLDEIWQRRGQDRRHAAPTS